MQDHKNVRDRWVLSLEAVRTQMKRATKGLPKKIDLDKDDKGRAWKWDEANDQEIRLIRLENEKLILTEGEDSM